MAEFFLFLPQMRLDFETLVARSRAAESAGFTGLALMDHLAPPLAESQPMHDAIISAAWLLAHTKRLKIGHLVLCDAFRHPAVLAAQVVSLDHASTGRFELGIGWGSVPAEFEHFGVMSTDAKARVARLGETLEVLKALWAGEEVSYDGEFHHLDAAQQQPTPLAPIPILIGGVGPKTLDLVARHAHWWNCPTHRLSRFDEVRERAGNARVSIQEQVTFIPSEKMREEVTQRAMRRFANTSDQPVVGNAEELAAHFASRQEAGIERFYIWFTDFAAPETLAAFGTEVIGQEQENRGT